MAEIEPIVGNITQILTRKHNDLQNRNVTPAHPSEAVGVLSPSSMFPQDIGKSWSAGIPVGDIYSLTYAGNGIVIAGGDVPGPNGKIYRSTDYGATWSVVITVGTTIQSLTYAGNGIVIAGDSSGNIYRSTDYGLTWSTTIPKPGSAISSLVYAGKNGTIIAGDTNNGIYRSTDYGLIWGAAIPVGNIQSLTYAGNGIVIAGDAYIGNIYRSTDYGINWTTSTPIPVGTSIYALTYAGNGIVIAGDGATGNIYRSTDYGLTWSAAILVGASFLALAYVGNGIIIAGDQKTGDIYRSDIAYKTDESIQDIEKPIISTSSDITLNKSQFTILVDASGANRTITLPPATQMKYHIFNIKKIDASLNLVIIGANGAETIDNSPTLPIVSQYESRTIQSDGSNWFII